MNFRSLLVVLGTFMLTAGTSVAFAAEEAKKGDMFGSLAAALAIGLAALGGSLGQAKVGAAALEGIARNPAAQNKIFVPMIIGLALIESLVLYAFVVALKVSA